jgi:hypothetical protein
MTSAAEKISTQSEQQPDLDPTVQDYGPEIAPAELDEYTERLVLAAAGAIQRAFRERRALRGRVEAQEKELTRLQAHVSLIHDSYRRLTSEFVTQFQLMEDTVQRFVEPFEQAVRDSQSEKESSSDR